MTAGGAAPNAGALAGGVVPSTWAPLRRRLFRWLWLAGVVSNIGTWMETVGAQWLLVDEPNAPTLVAAVQTAASLPMLLFALPAGVLADSFDRRRFLVAVQAAQVAVAGALAWLTAIGEMSPALLLTFTFALGFGATMTLPAYGALMPAVVPREQLPAAAALNGVSQNIARALGPALAGVLVAAVGPALVFALNAASFGVLVAVLAVARIRGTEPGEREGFRSALGTGGRFVRHSPVTRRILLRAALFVVPGSCLWALLPLVASTRLGLGAGGYGVLLAALGVGAVTAAFVLPPVRRRFGAGAMIAGGSLVYAVALGVAATVRLPWLVAPTLVLAGGAWLGVLTTLNAQMQLFLPNWVRARGLSIYLVVFQGGQAVAAVAWGFVAQHYGVPAAFEAAAVLMVASGVSVRWWPLHDAARLDREPVVYWDEPELAFDPEPEAGPILVTVTYLVAPEREAEFVAAMQRLRRMRLRTGATRWMLYRDGAAPDRFVENYRVPSWAAHLRQHGGRLTGADRAIQERVRALADGPPEVRHLFGVDVTH